MIKIELGLAVSDPRDLRALDTLPDLNRETIMALIGDASLGRIIPAGATLSHLYVGDEFCERLLPGRQTLRRALAIADRQGLRFVLATAVASDTMIDHLGDLLPLLPEGSEVVVNDWGVAKFVSDGFPSLTLIGGRQLAKMIKDPRLPSADWVKPYPAGFRGRRQVEMLRALGIRRVELDVPPFASPDTFAPFGLDISVRTPFSYVAKGRICKVGSLGQPRSMKFRPGAVCARQCLDVIEIEREPSALPLVQRGTTLFYRQDQTMLTAVNAAVTAGRITRIVVARR